MHTKIKPLSYTIRWKYAEVITHNVVFFMLLQCFECINKYSETQKLTTNGFKFRFRW